MHCLALSWQMRYYILQAVSLSLQLGKDNKEMLKEEGYSNLVYYGERRQNGQHGLFESHRSTA